MWRALRALFNPPRYTDFEEDRLSRVGSSLLAFLLVFSPLAAVTNFWLAQRTGWTWIITFGVHFALLVVARVCLQQRLLRQSLFLTVLSIWFILNYSSAFFAGGVSSSVYSGNLVVVVLAGFLLGRRGALGYTALSLLAGLAMVVANDHNMLPPDTDTRTDWSEWVTNGTFILCVVTAIYFFVTAYEHTLSRWRQIEMRLRGTNNQLRNNANQLASQNEYLEMVNQVTLDLINRRQLSEVLQEVVDRSLSMFGATSGYIYLLNDDGRMRVHVGRGVFEGRESHVLSPGDGLSGKVWAQNTPVRIDDYDAWEGRYEDNPFGLFASVIAVPLRSDGEVVGVLGVTRDEPGSPFNDQDVDLLIKFAELATIALDNARLFTSAKEELAVRVQAELRNQALLSAIPDPIMRVDPQGKYLDVRSPHTAVLPVKDLGSSLTDIVPESLFGQIKETMAEALRTQSVQSFEFKWPGTEDHFNLRAVAANENELLLIWRNVTEQVRTEVVLREKQKLESVGVLAGGIAHDFNNLLTGILAQTSILSAKLSADDPLNKHVDKALASAERAADLTRQLLAYAGHSKLGVVPIDLNDLVRENGMLLESAMSDRATLTLDLQDNLPPILAEPGQLQQLVMNLVINAQESLPTIGGIVQVATSLRMGPLGPPDVRLIGNSSLPAGPYVCLEIRDTGCGMDAATIERMFDPFYTTKETGHGLGLSATLGIISSYQGGIAVTSSPGLGSTFRVYIPAQLAVETVEAQPKPKRQLPAGKVLVIDDAPGVREALEDLLALEGLNVLTAQNGADGIELFRRHQAGIDLVIVDMVMPGLSGPDTIKAIRKIDQQMPMIMSSGYSREGMEKEIRNEPNIYVMPKPYDRSKLLEMLSQIVADRAQDSDRKRIAAP